MARAHYALASEWHPCHLSSAWDVIWWPNLHFHRVAGRGIVFSSSRWGVWRWMMNNILPVVVFFLILFSLLLRKVHDCPFCFCYFNFSPHFFYFNSYHFYKNLCLFSI
jgi:hypothetical protein